MSAPQPSMLGHFDTQSKLKFLKKRYKKFFLQKSEYTIRCASKRPIIGIFFCWSSPRGRLLMAPFRLKKSPFLDANFSLF
jgi:hypothetical protein